MNRTFLALLLTGVIFTFNTCKKDSHYIDDQNSTIISARIKSTTVLSETFEAGTKTAYAAANVTFSSGSWYLNNALVGNSASDRKFNTKSIRVQNIGSVRMNFNVTSGAGVVSVYHARYGTDANGTWEMWYSVDNGTTWTKTGATITTSSISLVQTSFTVNLTGNVRFEVRKTSNSGRLNFDNFSITDYSTTTPTQDNNMGMGNPSGAQANITFTTNYLMVKPQYSLSYNKSRGTANWVSWHLSSAWLGSSNADHSFTSDNTLPTGWYKATSSNYTNTGFDRGHMCPAADRSLNTTDNTATYVLTNVSPQAPNLNQIPWNNLEQYCRTLAGQGYEMYIVDGVTGMGGTGSNGGVTNTIAGGNITVPAWWWKSILILPNGQNDVSRVSSATRVITVVMPNTQTSGSQTWGYYRVTVDYLETLTGYDLWANVPATVQSSIESVVDTGPVN
ncbi:MAG: DNA/RNA non-specific endonuclease [Bacteroidetes bacterium]|nr:DNA/RNA non-specific endonuclease [Bacteroidota bacterium]